MGTWPVQQEQVQIVGAQKFKTFGDRFHAATRPIVGRPDLRLSKCLIFDMDVFKKNLVCEKDFFTIQLRLLNGNCEQLFAAISLSSVDQPKYGYFLVCSFLKIFDKL